MSNKLEIDPKLSPDQAAPELGRKPSTLAKWRVSGGGPRFIKSGGRILYRLSDLRAWMDSRTFTSTSEFHGGKR